VCVLIGLVGGSAYVYWFRSASYQWFFGFKNVCLARFAVVLAALLLVGTHSWGNIGSIPKIRNLTRNLGDEPKRCRTFEEATQLGRWEFARRASTSTTGPPTLQANFSTGRWEPWGCRVERKLTTEQYTLCMRTTIQHLVLAGGSQTRFLHDDMLKLWDPICQEQKRSACSEPTFPVDYHKWAQVGNHQAPPADTFAHYEDKANENVTFLVVCK
jgi:hypothetical protein